MLAMNLEEAEGVGGDDDCDDGPINLNIAVSGSSPAGVGDQFPPGISVSRSAPVITNDNNYNNNNNNNNARNMNTRTQKQGSSISSSSSLLDYPSTSPSSVMFNRGWSASSTAQSNQFGVPGRHPPSRFGHNCKVSNVTTGCFTFTCTIPSFPFEEETYHGANSCRMIVRPMSVNNEQVDPLASTRYKEFGAIAPEGPYRPGDIVAHTFEGLSAVVSKYGVGMVCENENGMTRYIDDSTGQLFEVKLTAGECPEAPDAPVAIRDASDPSAIHVQWMIPTEFHGTYEAARCKLVVRQNGKLVDRGPLGKDAIATYGMNDENRFKVETISQSEVRFIAR
jgi:hypothetical protein